MKKLFAIFLMLVSLSSFAQEKKKFIDGVLNRFTDEKKGRTVFIEKGSRAFGFSGGYSNFIIGGNNLGDGYSILSFLNIGNGKLHIYSFSPKFAYFVADDLAVGVKLNYSGYLLDSDLNLNLGQVGELELLNRHMHNNSWGGSVYMDKYLSVFGSKIFGFLAVIRVFILGTEELIERLAPFAGIGYIRYQIIIRIHLGEALDLVVVFIEISFLQLVEVFIQFGTV